MKYENVDLGRGTQDWTDEIKKSRVYEQLRPFNDVISGKEAPGGYGEPVLTDVVLDGITCDIYHSDKEDGDTTHRIFIHKKS
ncbi:MAG: hypothetical protein WAW92_00240 [Minisyncoccia bacterium]